MSVYRTIGPLVHCTFKNFVVKRLLPYITKHVSVILHGNLYSTRRFVRPKLASELLHGVSMS